MTEGTERAGTIGRSRDEIAERIAADLEDGFVVNLGVGIPLSVPRYLPADREILLHSENGLIGTGPPPPEGEGDADLRDAGNRYTSLLQGGVALDSAMSFAIVRGGRLDVTVLGALQVSETADLANWYTPGKKPAVGGAMDLVAGAKQVWVAMEHCDREGRPKLLPECTFPVTGRGVVSRVYTDLAIFHVVEGRLVLKECAPGVDPEQIRQRTAAAYTEELAS